MSRASHSLSSAEVAVGLDASDAASELGGDCAVLAAPDDGLVDEPPHAVKPIASAAAAATRRPLETRKSPDISDSFGTPLHIEIGL
jgi:hypothetical protein